MGLANHMLVIVVRAQTRVDTVIVCGGIAVIRAVRHIVFKHRCKPDGSHANAVDIAKMLFDAAYIAAVTAVRIHTVGFDTVLQRSHVVVRRVAIGKAVGHNQI